MNTKKRWLGGALLIATCALSPALAQQDADAPTQSGETGLFTLLTPQSVAKGGFSLGLYLNNWDRTVGSGDNAGVDWSRLSVAVGYGLTDKIELAVQVPYENIDLAGNLADGDGLGNIRVGAKFRLFEDLDKQSSFALNAFVEAPTGDDDVATDDTGFGVGASYAVKRFVVDLGFRDPGDDDNLDRQQEVTAGVGYVAPINDHFDWLTELVGTFGTGSGFGFDDSVDLTSGGRLWLGGERRWAFNFALRVDLLQADNFSDRCPLGGLVGLTFIPALGFAKTVEPPPVVAPAPPEPPPAAPEPTTPDVAPPPPPPPPPPKPEVREVVHFDSGSARLSNIAKAKLDEVALKMKQDPDLRAWVIGYADATGGAKTNEKLSAQRAAAVKSYLVQRHGLDGARINVEGRGTAEPAATNDTAAGRKDNRRAVVILKIE